MIHASLVKDAVLRLQRAGVAVAIERDPVQQERALLKTVAELYAQRRSSLVVADLLRVSSVTVQRWLRLAGVTMQKPGGRRAHQTKVVTINGVSHRWQEWFPPEAWSVHDRRVIYTRLLTHGWTIERALTTPITSRRGRRA